MNTLYFTPALPGLNKAQRATWSASVAPGCSQIGHVLAQSCIIPCKTGELSYEAVYTLRSHASGPVIKLPLLTTTCNRFII